LLDALGHRPRKQLGQNFLVDGNIVRKSLELGAVAAGDRVVEVGPGLGTLTGALLATGAEVFAIERDPVLAAHLRDTLVSASEGRLHLIEGDAVQLPLASLPESESAAAAASARRDFKIVANLPYAISTPWMEAVLAGPLPQRMVLMLQLEAAQRYAAMPGTKSFGAISVFLQAAYAIAGSHRVSRTCFHPVPDVDSNLIHLERRAEPASFSQETRALVRGWFQHRRKQLAPQVRRSIPDVSEIWMRELETLGVRADARPEDVPVAGWIALERELGRESAHT
ncbi:MAG: 16S rRNA (adenine(1518)-N(6)/adenine(1519)-N(6))-dimethyltransferase RsmA, partial [Opitutaceae bacterium]